MTDTTAHAPRPPLGVGDIIGSTFSIFFGRIAYILPLALIPSIAIELLGYLMLGPAQYSGEVDLGGGPGAGAIFLVTILNLAGTSLATGFVILAAYDARLGRQSSFGHYLGPVMQSLVTIVLCSIIVGIAVGLASIALVVPGLWLYGVWCVVVPAIVLERAGFGSLARSAELTRDYRWPCVGALILMIICVMIVAIAGVFVLGLVLGLTGMSPGVVGLVSNALANSVGLGVSGVCVALIYARLREIKEGTSVEQIVDVFS